MTEYKSREVLFFENGRIVCLGKEKTPKLVSFFCCKKKKLNQVVVGKTLEYLCVAMLVSSVLILMSNIII